MPTDPETDAALQQQKTVRRVMLEEKARKVMRAARDVVDGGAESISRVAEARGVSVVAVTRAVDAELARRGLPPRKGRGTR